MAESHGMREFIGGGKLVPHPKTAPTKRLSTSDAMAASHGMREFKGGGELAPHPETAAQTHGRRQPVETSV